MMNVIIGMGIHGGLDYFTDRFIEYLKTDENVNVYIVDVTKEETYLSDAFSEFCDRPDTVAFTFNNVLFLLHGVLGTGFWKKRGIPVFDYIQDHPRNYADSLLNPVCDLYAFALDWDHITYIKKYYKKVKGVFFSPNGGTKINNSVPFRDRPMDVIYMGSCKAAWAFPKADLFPENIDFFNGVLKYILEDPMLTTEDAIQYYISDNGLNCDDSILFKATTDYAPYIERFVRRYYKLEGMMALDKAGIEVHVYGEGWEDKEYKFSNNIHLHGAISIDDLMNIIGNAKISLCFIPWYKNGCSEKNFDSMLNGCLCVSDRSGYLEENYLDGVNIVYFDLNNPEQMAADVSWLLSNPSEAEIIAKRGFETAEKYDTWECRFRKMKEIMERVIGKNECNEIV